MAPQYHLVVVGFDEIVSNKYLPCIQEAINEEIIDSYSVIDLESQRVAIEERIEAISLQPRTTVYLPDPSPSDSGEPGRAFHAAIHRLRAYGLPLKMYIATEVKAHEGYLRYCIDNEIDSLVEKPPIAPLRGGRFKPSLITETMEDLLIAARRTTSKHSVMTLSRYHSIYNDKVIGPLRERMIKWQAPLTSLHVRVAGGVWNLQREFESREDHPYKYGYGMLMHGAYHYIDLAAQFLSLNKLILPGRRLNLSLSSYGAFPDDQHLRMSSQITQEFDDHLPRWPREGMQPMSFGETDITSTFRLVDVGSLRTLTLGTMSFEQTTPSIRHWLEIPHGLYNKNGRTSCVDIEAQISTLYSTHVRCYDVPYGKNADKMDGFARISTRSNASLFPEEKYAVTETFRSVFHSDSNRELMRRWLRGTEMKSSIADHLLPMKITEALALSLLSPGFSIEIKFS